MAESVLDLVGNTPIVKVPRLSARHGVHHRAQAGDDEPGRRVEGPARHRDDRRRGADGLLQPGGTIVEPTSGNTGVGLAIVAAQRGYQCIFVMTDKVAPEKIALLRAYGAEVVVCPVAVAPEDPQSYYSTAERLVRETRARSGRTSTPTPPTRWPTSDDRARRSGARPAGASPTSSPASAPAARSPASARYLKRVQPAGPDRRRRPRGLRVLRRVRPPLPGRGGRRGLLARHLRPVDRSTASSRAATRRASSWRGGSRARRASSSADREALAVAAAMKLGAELEPERPRRRADPRLGPRVPVARLQRRVDGGLRLPPHVRAVRRRRARRPRRRGAAAHLRQPRRVGARRHRHDASPRHLAAAGLQERSARSPPPRWPAPSTSSS